MNFICAVNILLDVWTHAGILNPYEQSVSVGILSTWHEHRVSGGNRLSWVKDPVCSLGKSVGVFCINNNMCCRAQLMVGGVTLGQVVLGGISRLSKLWWTASREYFSTGSASVSASSILPSSLKDGLQSGHVT